MTNNNKNLEKLILILNIDDKDFQKHFEENLNQLYLILKKKLSRREETIRIQAYSPPQFPFNLSSELKAHLDRYLNTKNSKRTQTFKLQSYQTTPEELIKQTLFQNREYFAEITFLNTATIQSFGFFNPQFRLYQITKYKGEEFKGKLII